MRRDSANNAVPSAAALLELVEAAGLWLTLPDMQAGIGGAQASLDVLKRVLNGRIAST